MDGRTGEGDDGSVFAACRARLTLKGGFHGRETRLVLGWGRLNVGEHDATTCKGTAQWGRSLV